MTARSSSSGSATSSATGGSSSTRPSAPSCTPRGRWRSPPGSGSATALDVQAMHADDGIVLRLPETDLSTAPTRPSASLVALEPGRGGASGHRRGRRLGTVRQPVPGVRRRARSCCRGGDRTGVRPCGSSASAPPSCCRVASDYGSFPIVLETMRECLQDVFDVPGLTDLMRDLESRAVRLVEVETTEPSPFARVAALRLRRPVPLRGRLPARRAAGGRAVPRHRAARRSCSARPSCASCSTRRRSPRSRRDLQRLSEDRRARDAEEAADLLRILGPLSTDEARERGVEAAWLVELEGVRRVIRVRVAGDERWAAIEDAGRLRDALGRGAAGRHPRGVPRARRRPVRRPRRPPRPHARALHGERRGGAPRTRHRRRRSARCTGSPRAVASWRASCAPAAAAPSGATPRSCGCCAAGRSRCCGRRPSRCPTVALARFLPAWQNVGSPLRGVDGVLRVVEQLQGAPLPPRRSNASCCPPGCGTTQPALLDELTTAGEVLWCGHGSLPGDDGWISLHLADERTADPAADRPRARRRPRSTRRCSPPSTVATRCSSGACRTGSGPWTTTSCWPWLWDLVWSGRLTNDSIGPLRTLIGGGRAAHTGRRQRAPHPLWPSRTSRPAHDAHPVRTAHGVRPLVVAAGAGRRPHPARARARRDPARPPRHRHPRCGRRRACPRWLRRRLPRAGRLRGGRPGAPRLRRRKPRGSAVLRPWSRRPAAHLLPRPRPATRARHRARPRVDGPGEPLRRRAPLAGAAR